MYSNLYEKVAKTIRKTFYVTQETREVSSGPRLYLTHPTLDSHVMVDPSFRDPL